MTTTDKLLPCPFCGGEADTMTPEADDMRAATVMCMGCYCTGKECETEAEAIAAWNRRSSQAAPAPSDGLREAGLDALNRWSPRWGMTASDKAAIDTIRAALSAPAQEGEQK